MPFGVVLCVSSVENTASSGNHHSVYGWNRWMFFYETFFLETVLDTVQCWPLVAIDSDKDPSPICTRCISWNSFLRSLIGHVSKISRQLPDHQRQCCSSRLLSTWLNLELSAWNSLSTGSIDFSWANINDHSKAIESAMSKWVKLISF